MLRTIARHLRLTWRLLRDPRVPLWMKAIPVVAVIYLLSPVDFIPDVLLGLGQLDDLGIVLAGLRLFEQAVPRDIIAEYRQQAKPDKREVIDVQDYTISHPDE